MPVAWRLVRESHAEAAFTGEGAAKYGGRWNSRGRHVVYASASLSLAALETLVHLVHPVTIRYAAFRVEFDEALLEQFPPGRLPSDWDAYPPGPASMAVGDEWLREARSAVLAVPSVIVAHERNYLLNPAHADFGKIAVARPEPFAFDPRLLRRR